jgi:hypothetical protein
MIWHFVQLYSECVLWVSRVDGSNACIDVMYRAVWVSVPW